MCGEDPRDLGSIQGGQAKRLLLLSGLLRQQHGVDVRQNSSLGDGDTSQELAELLVVPDGELDVPRHSGFFLFDLINKA